MTAAILLYMVIFVVSLLVIALVEFLDKCGDEQSPVTWGKLQLFRIQDSTEFSLILGPLAGAFFGGLYMPESVAYLGSLSISGFLLFIAVIMVVTLAVASVIPTFKSLPAMDKLSFIVCPFVILTVVGVWMAAPSGEIRASVFLLGLVSVVALFVLGIAFDGTSDERTENNVPLDDAAYLNELNRVARERAGWEFQWSVVSSRDKSGKLVSASPELKNGEVDKIAVNTLSPKQLSAVISTSDVQFPRKQHWGLRIPWLAGIYVIAPGFSSFIEGALFYPSYAMVLLGYSSAAFNAISFGILTTLIICVLEAVVLPLRKRRAGLRIQAWINSADKNETRTPLDFVATLAEAHLLLNDGNAMKALGSIASGENWIVLRAVDSAVSGKALQEIERVLRNNLPKAPTRFGEPIEELLTSSG